MRRSKRFVASVKCACSGILHTVKTERNMRIHAVMAFAALAACWWLDVPRGDVLLVFFSIGLVIAMELVNTAVEAAVDLVTPEWRELAKQAKDASAGAVLVAAITAALIGLAVFGPPLARLLFGRM